MKTLSCHSCGNENPVTNRFCGGCGAALARFCPACAYVNPPDHRFCGACGASLVAPPEPAPARAAGSNRRTDDPEARKVITIVFADLIGSTALHERLDPESVRRFMDRYYAAMSVAAEAHGGTVTQLLGDGVKAVFGVPRVAEDDAIRAVQAAVDMQRAFHELAREQLGAVGKTGLRIAVNSGEVVASEASEIIGDPVNVAARLQEAARDGEVVIGEATRRLVGALVTLVPLGKLALKGRSETVAAYRVVSLERPAASTVAFVGRDDELGRLAAVYHAAVAAPGARLAVVLGSPGVGKSRLLDEFTRRLTGATALVARCEAAGGATFAPIATAVRAVLGVGASSGDNDVRAAIDAAVPGGDADRARIAAGIGALLAGTPASPEETFFVVRRLLVGLAATRPVVFVLDDLQWAEPLLLDLLEHLVQWGTGAPLLLLAAARPDLRDARSSLVSPGRLVTDVVTLGGLDAAAATRLAANVIGADALPAAVTGRVLATSEGNPLFLGELVRMLVDDGALRREGDRWTAGVDLAAVDMPPTIHALLGARIERLRAEDRVVLERAAIIGRQFSRAAVAQLLPREAQGDLDGRLEALRRSELIEPDAGWFLGEPALRFHHGLTRDAAYRRVLKGTRAELHGRVADWIESRVGGAVEHDETIGWHLEQAHRHLGELGPIDAHGRALGERAARYLAAAGRRALERDDLPLAAGLLGRALARLDAADPARADLALDWCEALLEAGDVGPAAQALDELGRFTAGSDRLRAWHTCFAGQRAVLTDPQTLKTTVEAVAAAAAQLAGVGDGPGEAKAHAVHARALARLGQVGASEAALDKALAAARRADDRRRANAVLAGAPLAALWGPSPVTRASGRCLDVVRVLRITQGSPGVEAVALRCQAVLEALRGRGEAARRMIASSRSMVEELGITQGLLETEWFTGLIEVIEGDHAAAERSLRAAYDGLRNHGLGIDAARASSLLGRTLLAQGRAEEAEALSHESEALAGDDLQAAITWRRVRAEALAQRGEHAAAVQLGRAAVDIAAVTDTLLQHADARQALAAALRAAGRHDEAVAEEKQAIALWEAKGATVLAERARQALGRVEHVGRPPDDRRPIRPVRRRVGTNAATASAARFDAAVAARDADAFPTLIADEYEALHHPTGARWDRAASLASCHALLHAQEPTARHEPLAILGESLALCRLSTAASGFVGRTFDVGAYEQVEIHLLEVDALGRRRRAEFFVADRMGDAVVRLYERYAGLLPDGPMQARAAATARAVAALLGPLDADRWAAAIAPDVECIDNRPLGLPPLRGARAFLAGLNSLLDLVEDTVTRVDDVLALRPDALLMRWTNLGRARAGGGAYERNLIALRLFGADGLLTRYELFAPECDAEALARFEELTAEPAGPPRAADRRRRIRPNAATANAARIDAAIAGHDAGALLTLIAEGVEFTEHPTGVVYDREGVLRSLRSLLRARDPALRHEPLATVGETLALCHVSWSATRLVGGSFDVGAYEYDRFDVIEVDVEGRLCRQEAFAADRLADAVVRLYERYAGLLPDGPARTCAAATARSVALMSTGPTDPNRWGGMFAPDIQSVDHRVLGTWSAHGAEAVLQHLTSLHDLTDDLTVRYDDVLALRTDAFLVRVMASGTVRAGGGPFERPYLGLVGFGVDGLASRWEMFDVAREDAALARFDQLTAEPPVTRPVPRHVRGNAASAHAARLDAAIAARDADAVGALVADEMDVVDHVTGVEFDREGLLGSLRALLGAENPMLAHEPLATLGDTLALTRVSWSASGFVGRTVDVGAYEYVELAVIEVDARGRERRRERFAADRLGDAVARLYERHVELLPDGPERVRAAATARLLALQIGPLDVDRMMSAMSPTVEWIDHRVVGFGSAHGIQECRDALRALVELVDGFTNRADDVLALSSDAFLLRVRNSGNDRASGGAIERLFLVLWLMGPAGLATRIEQFDVGHEAEALARFEELVAQAPAARGGPTPRMQRRIRANAATAHTDRADAATAARDADALPALLADESVVIDHTTGAVYDREGWLGSSRAFLKAEHPALAHEALATLGDSLALYRESTSASAFVGRTFDVGAYERVQIALIEVDARGLRSRTEFFAADRLGDAVVRLCERHAELLPDGPARTRAAAIAHSLAVYVGSEDVDRVAPTLDPHIEYVDHRTIGLEPTRGAEAFLHNARSLHEVADDVANRLDDIVALRLDAALCRVTNFGRGHASGGAYERPFLAISVFGADGLMTRFEQFDDDRVEEALARFDQLAPSGAGETTRVVPFENAATRAFGRGFDACRARDWACFAALFAPGFRGIDRRRMLGAELDRDAWLASYRAIVEMTSPQSRREVLATRGDRLMLGRYRWQGTDGIVGPSEIEYLMIIEVDGRGDHVAVVMFDPDAVDAAYTELDERYTAGEAAPHARTWEAWMDIVRAIAARNWKRAVAVFAPGFVVEDHRPVALFGSLSRDDWVASARALVDLRPNVRFRVEHALAVDDGLSLNVAGWVGDEPDGAFEILPVVVTEHGADGIRRWHVYELDRFDAARACYDALAANAPPRPENAATRLTGRFAAAWAARDWEGLASLFAPGFRMTDRRRYAQLDLDRDRHLESLRFRFEMRSSSTALEVLATRGHRLALLHQRFELADGDVGPSETESVNVAESDEHGRFATLVTFDADQLDAAYAELDRRYADEAAHGQVALWMGAAFRPLGWETRDAALARGVDLRPDPLRIPPNAATRASERQRKGLELTVLATAGDRLALERVRCSHANDGTPVSQTETLSLTEIDADGRIVAVLDFDADDRRAASAELRDRYARSDAASAPAAMFEAFRAFNDHDLDRFRATLHNDFVFHDHRRTGVGTLARADYLASIPPLFEAAPDICSDTLYYIATEKNGSLAIGRDFGTLRDGGEFESVYVRIELYRDDRIVALEEFEPEHLDRARARFEELSRGA